MKKMLVLALVLLLAAPFCFAETVVLKSDQTADEKENEIITAFNNFFSALIERDIEKESLYINWEDFTWGGGPIGEALNERYKAADTIEQKKVRVSFLEDLNNTFLNPREDKLKRKMRLDDFSVVSVYIDSDNKAAVLYNEPFAKDKKAYFVYHNNSWLIDDMENADSVQ